MTTRCERLLDDMQRIAKVGSWEMDLTTNAVDWSQEMRRLLGYGPDEEPDFDTLMGRIHPDDRDATVRAIHDAVEARSSFGVELRLQSRDGPERLVEMCGRIELDADGRAEHLVSTVQDRTEWNDFVVARLHQELHDPLTGLPNRRLLVDRLQQALTRLARIPSMVGVIHLDVDRFRVINEGLGHQVGDDLLRKVATRLKELIRPQDTLARIDGDEFIVICEGLYGEAEAASIADRICSATTEPLDWEGGDLVLSVSAGVALAHSASVDVDVLLRDAAAAVQQAKHLGPARSAIFAERMRAESAGRLGTEISLRRSITEGDLRVYYQPIVNLVDGHVLGHEALARWAHPTRGLLGPEEFIAIAEESGLIIPLGAWILRAACLQAKRFQTRDPRWPRLTMSVNLSGAQLGQPDLVDLIASALRDSELMSEDLQLEMTESVLMDDAPTTITVLEALRDIGVRLSVDDFGTGYSSLSYLRRFPVDALKIDRTFVAGLGRDLEDSAIVAAVVSLADTLGFSTIAEGVESALQRDCLVGLGCSHAQGYLFARPVAAADAEIALDLVRAVASRP